ncbi:MAG: hypothetical protein Q8934_10335 [Bacillota bacterium]|nr:hypothetical protein [Bacillota bacterium]
MKYTSIGYHILPILHYTFSFLLLFLFIPKLLFKYKNDDWLERLFSNYAKMTFFIILVGYGLVIVKLYEVISLFMIFLAVILYRNMKKQGSTTEEAVKWSSPNKIFDLFDGLYKFNIKSFKAWLHLRVKVLRSIPFNLNWILEGLVLFFIICVSSYLRFYDTFHHAAPPMSDSYVTLAWMKYINGRQLFHDGIYPQGFHIYLATILKFAAVDALFILHYTGPFNSILTLLGLYIVIRKLSNNGFGALFAAWVYGIYSVAFPFNSLEREAATNSQEFAMLFVFPAVYFLTQYFIKKDKEFLYIAIICTSIAGLVHSFVFALIGALIGCMVLIAFFTLKQSGKQAIQVSIGALLAVGISLLPLGIGELLGKALHTSSAEYLVDRKANSYTYPTLTTMDKTSIILLVMYFLFLLIKRQSNEERFLGFFTVLSGSAVFTLYYAGGVWTGSTLLASRSIDLWEVMIPFICGMAISSILKHTPKNWKQILLGITSLTLIWSMMSLKLMPIIPYKLEHDENIEQYLRIRNHFLPETFLIVSQDEGYSVSLGTGYHMHLGDFLKSYTPKGENVTKKSNGRVDSNIPANIFIFQEKRIYKVSKSNSIYQLLKPKYDQRKKEYKQLTAWVNSHKKAGYKVNIYFEDKNIIIYYLQRKVKNADF